MWKRLTRAGHITVLCIAGDAESMDVSHVRWCYQGVWDAAWQSADMRRVKDMIRAWVAEVSGR
jgi:hypothetical protein